MSERDLIEEPLDFLPLIYWNTWTVDTKSLANTEHLSSGLQLLQRAFLTCFSEDLLSDGQIQASLSLSAQAQISGVFPITVSTYLFRGRLFTRSCRSLTLLPSIREAPTLQPYPLCSFPSSGQALP